MKKQRKKSKYVSDETFAEIEESFEQALKHARGERHDLRVMRVAVPRPPRRRSSGEIVRVCKRLNYSQSSFARVLNVSVKTVQAWE